MKWTETALAWKLLHFVAWTSNAEQTDLLLFQTTWTPTFKLCNIYRKNWAIPAGTRIPDPMCVWSVSLESYVVFHWFSPTLSKSEDLLKMCGRGCTTSRQDVFLIQTNRHSRFSQGLRCSGSFLLGVWWMLARAHKFHFSTCTLKRGWQIQLLNKYSRLHKRKARFLFFFLLLHNVNCSASLV